jgi:hypothetical protein
MNLIQDSKDSQTPKAIRVQGCKGSRPRYGDGGDFRGSRAGEQMEVCVRERERERSFFDNQEVTKDR